MRPALACALLALLAWSGSLTRAGFALDDREVLFENPVVTGALPASAAFDRDFWHHRGDAGLWRPLPLLALRADRALWGSSPAGYHLTNVLLHAAVVLLAGLVLARLRAPRLRGREPLPSGAGAPPPAAWLGLAVFAVHPALADSVAWISGRSSSLAALGGLAGAWALERALAAERVRGTVLVAAGALGLVLALAAREDALVFAPLYLLLAARSPRPVRARALAATAAGVALGLTVWLAAREHALGSVLAAPTAPLADAPLGARLRTGGGILVEALRLAVLPLGHPPRWDVTDLPLADRPALAGVVAGLGWALLGATLLGAARALRRRPSVVAGSALVGAGALLPYTQLVPGPELLAPRFLYLPLCLGAPFLGAVLGAVGVALSPRTARVPGGLRARPVPRVLLAGTVLFAVGAAWQRSGVYATRTSYWRERLAHAPGDPAAWNEIGLGREEAGDSAGARAAWQRAVELDPRYSRAHSNLGRVLLAAGELEAAAEVLARAARVGPRNPVAQVNEGAVLLRLGRPAAAAAAYERATALAPGFGAAWRGLGHARLAAGELDRARAALERAAALDPADLRAQRLLARLARAEAESR